jgi:hypothetical protein
LPYKNLNRFKFLCRLNNGIAQLPVTFWIITVLISCLYLKQYIQDNPFSDNKRSSLIAWLKTTPKDSVVFCSQDLNEKVLLFGGRSTFLFLNPFNERTMAEWYDRERVYYGDYSEWRDINSKDSAVIQKTRAFSKLTPKKVIDASEKYRIDFVILLNTTLAPINQEFFKFEPRKIIDGNIYVWALSDLKKIK